MRRRQSNEGLPSNGGLPAALAKSMEGMTVSADAGNPDSPLSLLGDTADNIICPTLHIKGELYYDALLRVDGTFAGKLISKGSIIVGPSGRVMCDLLGLKDVLVDGGCVEGRVECERLMLRCGASATGDVACKALIMDETCKMKGAVVIA